MLVAPAPPSAPAQHKAVGLRHVLNDLLGLRIPDDCATGDPDHQIFAVLPSTPFACAVGPVPGGIFAFVAEVHQGGQMVVDLHDDVSAPSAVAAVRSAVGDIQFSAETDMPVAAFPRPY